MISDYFSFVFRTFRHRPLRSWLTVIGVLIGIAAVVALISLGQGVQKAVNDAFSGIGTDKIMVVPGGQGGFYGPGSTGLITAKLTKKDVDTINSVRGVEHSIEILSRTARAEFSGQTKFVSVFGASIDRKTVEIASNIDFLKVEEGRFLKEGDKYKAVIGYVTSNELFDKQIKINDRLVIEEQSFTVIGLQKKSGSPMQDRVVRIPIEAAREILNAPDEISMILVKVNEGYSTEEVSANIQKALRTERNVKEGKEDFNVITSNQLIAGVNSILYIIQIGLVGVAGISLVVGSLGIMNTMYTAVAERTKEIGIMKAIGATNHDITMLFLIESGMLGLMGGIVGILIGFSLSKIVEVIAAVSGFEILKAYLPLELILFSLIFSFLIGAASGVLPARAAAKLRPAEAIRKW
jgi:putative ABC transport system permease protein